MEYKENKLFIDKENQLVGILTLPENRGRHPAVLLLHGFASHKNEVGDMFADLAAKLAVQGVGSLRIDFRGWGESGGEMADTAVPQLIEDAQTAIHFLLSHSEIDAARLGIVGFSLGAAIAVLVAAEQPERFKTMALWSPAMRLRAQFIASLGAENFAYAKKHGQVTIDLGWRSVTLKSGFFDSLSMFNPEQAIAHFPGSLLAIAGNLDVTAAENAQKYVVSVANAQKRLLILDGADHTFNVLSGDRSAATAVLDATTGWLVETVASA